MQLAIQLHVGRLSLSSSISILDPLGVDRSRKAVHDRVQKANLQSDGGESPNRVAVDESVIRINDQQYWLYAPIDPATKRFLHIPLFSTFTTAQTELILRELRGKYDVENAEFLVDDAQWLQTALQRNGLDFRYERHGTRNGVERVFREVQRRTPSLSHWFIHVDPATAENWLQTFEAWWNC